MTRKDLVQRVREGLVPELSDRQVAEVIERTLAEIAAAVARDGRIVLPGFGTFTVRHTAARVGRNPRTGEVVDLPAAATVAFKPAPELRAALPEPPGGG